MLDGHKTGDQSGRPAAWMLGKKTVCKQSKWLLAGVLSNQRFCGTGQRRLHDTGQQRDLGAGQMMAVGAMGIILSSGGPSENG